MITRAIQPTSRDMTCNELVCSDSVLCIYEVQRVGKGSSILVAKIFFLKRASDTSKEKTDILSQCKDNNNLVTCFKSGYLLVT